jgi:glycosyltransferase involved in cell wall biosynthesis
LQSESKYRAVIPPAKNIVRPLWSVMIPVYNCAGYLRQTLEAVLAQDPGRDSMQIEVVDDCSSDNPEQVVWEVGKGRVNYFRQDKNVGHTKNFESCLKRSTGIIVHQLHGDDLVYNGFYSRMEALFAENPTLGAGFCQNFLINDNNQVLHATRLVQRQMGIIPAYLHIIGKQQDIFTPSIVVKREVYEKLGGFDERLAWCEDWEMWTRIAASGYAIGYIPEILAGYRVHNTSNTARYSKNAEKIRDLQKGIQIINNYLPARQRRKYYDFSMNYYAEAWALPEAVKAYEEGNYDLAKLYLKEVKKMAKAATVKMRYWRLYFQLFGK